MIHSTIVGGSVALDLSESTFLIFPTYHSRLMTVCFAGIDGSVTESNINGAAVLVEGTFVGTLAGNYWGVSDMNALSSYGNCDLSSGRFGAS